MTGLEITLDRQPSGDTTPDADSRDLGFGARVVRESRQRLLNRDGSFNVVRHGVGYLRSLSAYHALLTMSWPRFFAYVIATFVLMNVAFASVYYYVAGPAGLNVPVGGLPGHSRFANAFFFSVETFTTIGFGHVFPMGLTAHSIMAVESLVGLLAAALVTGLLFARFARPTACVVFSDSAVIAPYAGGSAFEFRLANVRSNELIEAKARVLFTRLEQRDGEMIRRFYTLALERSTVTFLALSWTVVHPIADGSPLLGLAQDDLLTSDAEFLVLLTAFDETFSQTVHARTSYKPHEVVWNARFLPIIAPELDGSRFSVNVAKVHEIERVRATVAGNPAAGSP